MMKSLLAASTATLALTFGATAATADINLTQSAKGLEPLKGLHYEGWSLIGGRAVTTGGWNIEADGTVIEVNANGEKIGTLGTTESFVSRLSDDHQSSTAYVLTIEPDNDTDLGPSSTHIVAGGFDGNTANAVVGHGGAIGTEFGDVSGSFILAAPTGGADNQGIWFFDGDKAALNLPDLPRGWNYEGWVVDTRAGNAISTGIFHAPDGADEDGAGKYAGAEKDNFPPAPGQDFVQGMSIELDNGDHIAVITVEPADDPDPAPFFIKVLKSDTISGNGVLTPTGDELPTVRATRS
jgi:hypothetical protein